MEGLGIRVKSGETGMEQRGIGVHGMKTGIDGRSARWTRDPDE
jgi:hypothetical protein